MDRNQSAGHKMIGRIAFVRKLSALKPVVWIAVTVSLAIGCAVTIGAELWWESSAPTIVSIKVVSVKKINSVGHALVIDSSGTVDKNCLKITQHVLFYDKDNRNLAVELGSGVVADTDAVKFTSLGTSMSGMGFISSPITTLFVPPDVPNGTWTYVNRSSYFCSVAGLLRIVAVTSEPIKVELN